jgi:hypothetical protein
VVWYQDVKGFQDVNGMCLDYLEKKDPKEKGSIYMPNDPFDGSELRTLETSIGYLCHVPKLTFALLRMVYHGSF